MKNPQQHESRTRTCTKQKNDVFPKRTTLRLYAARPKKTACTCLHTKRAKSPSSRISIVRDHSTDCTYCMLPLGRAQLSEGMPTLSSFVTIFAIRYRRRILDKTFSLLSCPHIHTCHPQVTGVQLAPICLRRYCNSIHVLSTTLLLSWCATKEGGYDRDA